MEFMPTDEQWKKYFLGSLETCDHVWETVVSGDVVLDICKKCGATK